jgi:hypothetical protein
MARRKLNYPRAYEVIITTREEYLALRQHRFERHDIQIDPPTSKAMQQRIPKYV